MCLRRWLPAVALAFATSCGGGSDAGNITRELPPVPVIATVSVTPAATSIDVGGNATFTADVRDQFGGPFAVQAVTWTSSSASIAPVSSAGVVNGLAPGTVTITASVSGKSGTATLTVAPAAVSSVSVPAPPAALNAGESVQLSAIVRDRSGASLQGRVVAWASSSAAIATVDAGGKVTAVGGGSATITATSEGVSGSATIVVLGVGAVQPTITSISPATLAPGSIATITGTGFDAATAGNVITIRGVSVTALTATPTQITLTIPCVNQGAADVQVTANQRKGAAFTSTVAVPQRSLAVGQAIVASDASCNELTAVSGAARYIVSVFSAAASENTLVDFEIDGNPASAVSPFIAQATPARTMALAAPGPEAARDRAHFAQLERNRANLAEGQRLSALLPSPGRSLIAARAALPAIGDARDFYMTFGTTCNDTTQQMHGKVIYVGAHAIVWEDSTNVLQSSKDPALAGYYQRLGKIFDADQYDVIRTNFGDPLLRDAVTDNDGHINMVFSDRLNNTGAAAYVSSCDQFPTTVFKGSNFGQMFYGFTPTTTGSNLNSTLFPDGWFIFMGRTVVHEVKHIASLSARVVNNASFEESWLEEGTARHAEELWTRQYIHKASWKGNNGFGSAATNGVFCDFHPENSVCNAADGLRRPSYGVRRQFNEIRNKLVQPWNWSIYGDGSGQSGSVFYQTTWSLVRYAIDRYATSEASFLTALTSSRGTGLANLSALAGVSPDQLFGLWTLSLYADDYPGLTAPSIDIQFPTWNLRSIYAGLNTDPTWGSTFTTPFPIVPVTVGFGSFASQRRSLRGGANAYFELQGTSAGPQLLNVRSLSGGAASSNLRIAIARLQ
ncbi:MAG: hypothetical protein JWM95_2500 [Gemmatimonadetes bacterium]|nr:hypothetical protein [Gemmatimonadota bacterium]